MIGVEKLKLHDNIFEHSWEETFCGNSLTKSFHQKRSSRLICTKIFWRLFVWCEKCLTFAFSVNISVDQVAPSNDQNKTHEPVVNKELDQSLVIPEKASSFKVHPERLCKDQCFYCGGKFGLYDTPCHIAQIKSVERQKKILDSESLPSFDFLTRDFRKFVCYRWREAHKGQLLMRCVLPTCRPSRQLSVLQETPLGTATASEQQPTAAELRSYLWRLQCHRLQRECRSQYPQEVVHEDEEDDREDLPRRHGSAAEQRQRIDMRGTLFSTQSHYGVRYVQEKAAEESYLLYQSGKTNSYILLRVRYLASL